MLVPGADRVKVPSRKALAPRAVCVPSNLWAQRIPLKDVGQFPKQQEGPVVIRVGNPEAVVS